MTTLLCITFGLIAAGAVALTQAVRHAPEGLETEQGFVPVPVTPRSVRRRRRAELLRVHSAPTT